jgi:hypothetical protein
MENSDTNQAPQLREDAVSGSVDKPKVIIVGCVDFGQTTAIAHAISKINDVEIVSMEELKERGISITHDFHNESIKLKPLPTMPPLSYLHYDKKGKVLENPKSKYHR